MNKEILILGSSGFIGRNLIEKLSPLYNISSPTRLELDLLDKKSVDKYFSNKYFDILIYCVNEGGTRVHLDSADTLANNLRMFFNVTSKKSGFMRMLFLGSGAEYGKNRSLRRISEDDFGAIIPHDYYGYYKYICSRYIEKSENIVNLRLFGIFGKYEDYRVRFISNAICRDILGLSISISQNVYFDYMYIDDFAKIVAYFIDNPPKRKFYNIGGQRTNLADIAKIVKGIGTNNKKINILKPKLGKEYTSNNSLLLNELKDFKFTPLEESIGLLYKFYSSSRSKINKKGVTNY